MLLLMIVFSSFKKRGELDRILVFKNVDHFMRRHELNWYKNNLFWHFTDHDLALLRFLSLSIFSPTIHRWNQKILRKIDLFTP